MEVFLYRTHKTWQLWLVYTIIMYIFPFFHCGITALNVLYYTLPISVHICLGYHCLEHMSLLIFFLIPAFSRNVPLSKMLYFLCFGKLISCQLLVLYQRRDPYQILQKLQYFFPIWNFGSQISVKIMQFLSKKCLLNHSLQRHVHLFLFVGSMHTIQNFLYPYDIVLYLWPLSHATLYIGYPINTYF